MQQDSFTGLAASRPVVVVGEQPKHSIGQIIQTIVAVILLGFLLAKSSVLNRVMVPWGR